jgi:hypothetical protein
MFCGMNRSVRRLRQAPRCSARTGIYDHSPHLLALKCKQKSPLRGDLQARHLEAGRFAGLQHLRKSRRGFTKTQTLLQDRTQYYFLFLGCLILVALLGAQAEDQTQGATIVYQQLLCSAERAFGVYWKWNALEQGTKRQPEPLEGRRLQSRASWTAKLSTLLGFGAGRRATC